MQLVICGDNPGVFCADPDPDPGVLPQTLHIISDSECVIMMLMYCYASLDTESEPRT
jgi:hypothetical protein